MRSYLRVALCLMIATACAALSYGQWAKLANNATVNGVTISPSTMLLLLDGTVMCQDSNGSAWYRLTPVNGSYANGTWTAMPSMTTPRLYYASSVLADGRVIIAGGEYRGGNTIVQDNTYEIYSPYTNSWSTEATVPGMNGRIGDAPCTVLADGRFLLGQSGGGGLYVIFTPGPDTWSSALSMLQPASEESWSLLPDGTVVTAQCRTAPGAEKYLPASNTWVSAGTVTPNIVELSSNELGSQILLPPGNAFGDVLALGGNGNASFYNIPNDPSAPGSWSPGPTMPLDGSSQQLGCKDTPGILLPNGNVLFTVGPVDGIAGNFNGPTSFLLWDYYTNTYSTVADPPAPFDATKPPYTGRMLLLPTGQVLFNQETGDGAVYIYTPPAGFEGSWRPILDDYPTRVIPGRSYTITGRQFNGMSQASGYGDDAWAPTNYPIVRIRNNGSGNVVYCRTRDHSSMGVQTGNLAVSTTLDIPAGIEAGDSTIVVIANGIPSTSRPITIEVNEPITSAQLSGTLGNNGWYVSDVTVSFSVDALVNLGLTTYHRLNGGAPAAGSAFVVNTDLNPHGVEFWSLNGPFEENPHNFLSFKRDATDPTLSFQAQSPAKNAFGWNNEPVTIGFTTGDNLSGVASVSPGSPLVFNAEGALQNRTVTVTDNAGNDADFTSANVNIDLTDPSTTQDHDGPPGCNGWYQGDVSVTLSASDALSGVRFTKYRIDGGAETTYGGAFMVVGDGIHTVEYWSQDYADNEETHHTVQIAIDGTPPVVTGTADKTEIWSPNHKMVPVTVTGLMTDAVSGIDPATAAFHVVDEYGLVQPSGAISVNADGTYSFTTSLEASRLGQDKDGRTYTIYVTVSDNACNETTISIVVRVPHDQRGGLNALFLPSGWEWGLF